MAQEYTPLQPKAAQPRPNMFANWPQNGQGNWANMVNTARKATDEYVGNTLQGLGVSDPQKPQTPVTPPYEAGTVVLPPKNTNQGNGTIKVTDSQPNPYSATETGGAIPIRNMDELVSAMYTDPKEEERLRKASVANQRILAVGDALRHIGNIFNTVNYAPAQKFNNPVQEEYDRYQKGKAIRDAANARYYSYMQAKAAQDARIRQAERQFQYNAAKDAATAQALKDYRDAKMNAEKDKWKEQLAFSKDKWKDQSDLNERKFQQQTKHQNTMAGIASRNASTNAARLAWQKSKGAGGRTGSPYVLPTKNGYINLGRDLNSNQIGKKALFGKLKDAHIIDDVWQKKYDNMYTSDEQSALLNTAISQWLMTDDSAEGYMKTHFGATPVSGVIDLGLTDDDDEDEMDLGLE